MNQGFFALSQCDKISEQAVVAIEELNYADCVLSPLQQKAPTFKFLPHGDV